MKQIHKLLMVFGCLLGATALQAQSEFSSMGSTLPPSGSGLSTPKIIKPTMFPPKTTTPSNSSSMLEDPKLQFKKNNDFGNPGDAYKDKLNSSALVHEGGFDSKVFRKNQYFGDHNTKGEFVKISCRDFGEVDGDEIRVWVNDRIVVESVFLTSDFRAIQLGLTKGFNKIDFEALNQGTSGPNTAQFLIYDDKGNQIADNQWNLGTGFKATIIVVKE